MGKALCIVAPLKGMFAECSLSPDCGYCYQIDMGALVGIIACDIILTLLIALAMFCFASLRKKRSQQESRLEGKGKTLTASKRKTVEITESPYQELHGIQSDVYSDLQQFQK
ncbi:TYRO protein tyrosine kinase-binding protein-like [Salvelinus namaycush]|uniref:TYRO protein tyrosine kinase-binding protein n=1 Tax=Salvelinus namaycush TaxID=8040 RepID=A0A8U0UD32_SALNM|nr:TYRO protein tyrosine kinase-binding protein-like [Salvelinus namaycush]